MSEIATSVLATGLANAHAMESQALELLERQASRLEAYPEVQAQIQHHLAQTGRQLDRLEQCMDALGEDASATKDAELGNLMSPSNAVADDEILKDTFANYSFEHYEIAAYRSLLTLCEIATQRSIVPLLQQSLEEEEAMAKWLKDNLSRVTKDYVTRCEKKAAA
ncbi:MAG: ferritin-like domain-containing protein [Aestuariivirgaceae bacterium]